MTILDDDRDVYAIFIMSIKPANSHPTRSFPDLIAPIFGSFPGFDGSSATKSIDTPLTINAKIVEHLPTLKKMKECLCLSK
jgi:hypothetical protein